MGGGLRPAGPTAGPDSRLHRRLVCAGALAVADSERTSIVESGGRVAARIAGTEPSWSPDGRLLAVSGAKGLALYTAGGRLRFTKRGFQAPSEWSPSGREVLVLDSDYRIARVRIDGSTGTATYEEAAWATWTPTGGLLALEGGLLVLREGGSVLRSRFPVPSGPCGGGLQPAEWVDRDHVVLVGGLGGRNAPGLWVVDPRRGPARRLLGGFRWLQSPLWSPDGSVLAYTEGDLVTHADSCQGPAFPKIGLVRADGSGARTTADPADAGEDRDPVWSLDSARLAVTHHSYEDSSESIVLIDVETLDRQRLTRGSRPSWASDKETVVYALGSQIRRVPVDGGASTVLGTGSAPVASPVSPVVAFLRDGALWTMSLDGGAARRLATLRKGAAPPQWSPDGKRLVLADSGGLTVVTLEGGRSTRIARVGAGSPAWSPDGRLLAFSAPVGIHSRTVEPTERREVYLVSATGGAPRRVTSDLALVAGVSWRP